MGITPKVLVAAALSLLAACASPASNSVDIRLIAFKPETLSVPPGSEVTWTNSDDSAHTVTSGTVEVDATGEIETAPDERFASGSLTKDATFAHTFDDAGGYRYFCEIHPATMQGLIEVR